MAPLQVGLVTWGSQGDVRPILALAGGLAAAGHTARVVISDPVGVDYAPLCRVLGVEHTRVPERIEYDIPSFAQQRGRLGRSIRTLKLILDETFYPYVDELYEAALSLCGRSDVLVGHMAMHPARAAAMKTGTPYVSVTSWPGTVPTAYEPPHGLPNLGRFFNGLEWRLARFAMDRLFKKDIARFWAAKGFAPFRHVLDDAWFSRELNLVAASAVLWREPPDWPPRHRLTGHFRTPRDAEGWRMSAQLQAFLDGGAKPILMTLGTAQYLEPEKEIAFMSEAARRARCRAIIQGRSDRHAPGSTEEDIYFVEAVGYSIIFPRCAAVVHHGGAGTTQMVLEAELPSVVVAFNREQASWGARIAAAGAGARPLWRSKATAPRLGLAIRAAVESADMRRAAARVGRKMRAENGVEKAVGYIEELARA